MKNGTAMIKRFMIFALVALLAMDSAACSRGKNSSEPAGAEGKGNPESGTRPSAAADGKAAVQYDYSGTIVDFQEYGDVALLDIAGKGDQIYVLMEIRNWGPEPEDNTQRRECAMSYRVFSCMADGSGKDVSKEIYPPEESGYMDQLQLSDNGCMAALFHSDTDDAVSLMFWDGFHDIHWEKPAASGMQLFLQGDRFIVLADSGEERSINTYDARGELMDSVKMDRDAVGNFQTCFVLPDSRFLMTKQDKEGMPYAEIYDPQTGQGERKALPDGFSRYHIFRGTAADFVLCDSVGVYQMNLDGDAPAEIFNFVDADFDANRFPMVWQANEACLAGAFYSPAGGMQLGLFSRSEVPEGSRKQIIVLGTMLGDSGSADLELREHLTSRIRAFNRTNSQYRITMKQYDAYNKMFYDKELALAQLDSDILAGKMPDILLADDAMPLQSYISKGLLADVGKLIEEDEELDRGQFMENIFDAFCVQGSLYYVVSSFAVDTLVAKQSRVGERTGWNQEEFAAVASGLPTDTEIIPGTSGCRYLEDYMRVCGREYVDMDQRKCNFQSDAFVSVLQFAATLPEDSGGEDLFSDRYHTAGISYDSRYIEDRALLQPVSIWEVYGLAKQINGCIGEEIAYVGYPVESRQGSCVRICGSSFVLSSRGSVLEGAWEFVRDFLTEDYQRNERYYGSGMSVRRDVFEEEALKALKIGAVCLINGEYIQAAPLTQGQIDRAVDFIRGLRNSAFEDKVIRNIIYEEAQSFFQGQRTAEDVAALIQNRAQLYLDEGM